MSPFHSRRAMASAIGPAVVAKSHGPADCRCGGEGAARPFPLLTEIFAGDAGGLMRALSPPARAIVARQGRDAIGGSVGAQRR
jgi:hypothetical protein